MDAIESKIHATLLLFNEKAEKLTRSSLVKTMLETKTGVSLITKPSQDGLQEIHIVRSGPGEESFDAFILTLRFFFQDNDEISFKKMSELYRQLATHSGCSHEQRLEAIRKELNTFLDKATYPYSIMFNGEKLTRRRILDVIMYGVTAHANPDKQATYTEWASSPLGAFIDNEFAVLLVGIVDFVDEVRGVNQEVLASFKRT